jgi:hypothetical protein
MIVFILGCIVGGLIGIVIMAVLSAGKMRDDIYRMGYSYQATASPDSGRPEPFC